jgi:hypothetical protein
MTGQRLVASAWMLLLLALFPAAPAARARIPIDEGRGQADKALVVDGSAVLTAGAVHVNVTNWGLIGSRYSEPSTYFNAPSCQWPGGSGKEYVFAAGLWISGRQYGVTSVSCGVPEAEIRADAHYKSVLYECRNGRVVEPQRAANVAGIPGDLAGGNDDGDELVDEDPPDGLDQDGDGLVDEDFAQRGTQMLSCVMRDDEPISTQMFPDHRPLGLEIRQEACAWDTPDQENMVGLRWVITNKSLQPIEDLYVGLLVDSDIGFHDDPDAGKDDLAGIFEGLVRQSEGYFEDLAYAWMRDGDAENALSGWLAVTLDGNGFGNTKAQRPAKLGLNAIRILNADYSQGYGGVPAFDSERHTLLSRPGRDPDVASDFPDDYILLLSVGPYEKLEVGEYVVVDATFVVAQGQVMLQESLRRARDVAKGRWYNNESTPASGWSGLESLVCAEDFGSFSDNRNPIYKRYQAYWDWSCMPPPGDLMLWPIKRGDMFYVEETGKHCIWVNMDNCDECRRRYGRECTPQNGLAVSSICFRSTPESRGVCTGLLGRETRVPFVTDTVVPPAPTLRLNPGDGYCEVYWNDEPEHTPDPLTGALDLEAYRIWRADEWHRPAGTSEATGPPVGTWAMRDEFDLINFYPHEEGEFPRAFGRNTGFAEIDYRPVCLDDPRFAGLAEAMTAVVHADTAGLMRELPPLRDHNGVPEPDLVDLLPWEMHRDVLDTFFAVTERPQEVGVYKRPTGYYRYRDEDTTNGFLYFYSVTTTDHVAAEDGSGIIAEGGGNLPSGGFDTARPRDEAQTRAEADGNVREIYVYPNPATRQALAEFQQMDTNADDPTGVRVSFANLPRCRSTIEIFTLSGDLVQTIEHDGSWGNGQAYWNLMSRNGQEVVSGIYLFSVRPHDGGFDDFVGKFVVVR